MGVRRWFKNLVGDAVAKSIKDAVPADIGRQRPVVYLGNDTLLTYTKYGHKINLVASDRSLTPHIALDGYWEQWITDVFRSIVRPGMHVVDVGANVGYYTILAAEAVGSAGKVTAFEANPKLADIVHRNMDVNGFLGRVRIVDKAAYSESAELSFSVYKNYKGSSGLWGTSLDANLYRDEVDIIKVQAVPLDLELAGQSVDFVKIDAEGAEGHILKGAAKTIEANPDIQFMVEYAPRLIESCFGSVKDFHDMIGGYGFSPHVILHDATTKAMSFDELLRAGITHCDILLKKSL